MPTDGAGSSMEVASPAPDGGITDYSNTNPLMNRGDVGLIKGGLGFGEGTAWNASAGELYFSEMDVRRIWRHKPPSTTEMFRENSNRSNGLAFDPQGRMVICETAVGRITRATLGSAPEVLTERWPGGNGTKAGRFSQTNDVVARSDGNLYFTDPRLNPVNNELDFEGVYRISPDGTLSIVTSALNVPNGIALSPDEKTLYVAANGNPGGIWRFPLGADGAPSGNGEKFINSGSDGMAIDDAGNLYLSSGSIKVHKPSGASWGTIAVPGGSPTNSAFGGTDRKTLFIITRTGLYSVRLGIPGLP